LAWPQKAYTTFLKWAELESVTQAFFDTMTHKGFLYKEKKLWMSDAPRSSEAFFDIEQKKHLSFCAEIICSRR